MYTYLVFVPSPWGTLPVGSVLGERGCEERKGEKDGASEAHWCAAMSSTNESYLGFCGLQVRRGEKESGWPKVPTWRRRSLVFWAPSKCQVKHHGTFRRRVVECRVPEGMKYGLILYWKVHVYEV